MTLKISERQGVRAMDSDQGEIDQSGAVNGFPLSAAQATLLPGNDAVSVRFDEVGEALNWVSQERFAP